LDVGISERGDGVWALVVGDEQEDVGPGLSGDVVRF